MRPPQSLAPRRALRIPLRAETIPEGSSSARYLGYVANLSETGAFLQCSNPRPTGTRLRLLIHLSEVPGGALACEAEVIWTRSYAGSNAPCAGMGVRLLSIDPRQRKALHRFCQQEDPLRSAVPRVSPAAS